MKSPGAAAVSHYNDHGYYAPIRVLSPAKTKEIRLDASPDLESRSLGVDQKRADAVDAAALGGPREQQHPMRHASESDETLLSVDDVGLAVPHRLGLHGRDIGTAETEVKVRPLATSGRNR
jgi:hypothetical protein